MKKFLKGLFICSIIATAICVGLLVCESDYYDEPDDDFDDDDLHFIDIWDEDVAEEF